MNNLEKPESFLASYSPHYVHIMETNHCSYTQVVHLNIKYAKLYLALAVLWYQADFVASPHKTSA